MKEFTIKVTKEEEVPVLDKAGKPVLDEKGKPKKDVKTTENTVEIAPIKVQKGKGAGTEYYALKNISTIGLDYLLTLFPAEQLMEKLFRPKLKQFCSVIHNEAAYDAGRRTAADVKAESKDGKTIIESPLQDEEKYIESFQKMFSTLSARGESIMGLTKLRNELFGELTDLSEDLPDYQERVVALLAKVKKVQEALASKKTEDEEEKSSNEDNVKVAA